MRDFEDYQQLAEWMSDMKWKRCKKCGIKTWHFKRGFEGYNQRWCCLKCEEKEK
jgi:hypothetical protein